jgi:redox-sensing transcriptional repressor
MAMKRFDKYINVPEVVILRLPLYIRVLSQLDEDGVTVISSHQLGELLQITPAQIRKDLSYFGRFGKQGRGYNILFLLKELKHILGIDHGWKACLVGVGRLGRAIVNYPGFSPGGFEIVAAFDVDESKSGSLIGSILVQSVKDLPTKISDDGIQIGIVAVPSSQAQDVIDHLVKHGITGILNYAPIAPIVPKTVTIRNVDPVLSLQSMTFYMTDHGK